MAWLDGTSGGEADAMAHVKFFAEEIGCPVLALIPDRNWNIADPATKADKVAKLEALVQAGRAHDMIFAIGTEMNNYGQKFVDDFDAPELAPYTADFVEGAMILYGSTLAERACGRGLTSRWAASVFQGNRVEAKAFYKAVGEKGFPPREAQLALEGLPRDADKEAVLAALDGCLA